MVKLIDSRSIDPEGFNDEKSLGLRLNKLEDIADSSNITPEILEKYFVLSEFYQYFGTVIFTTPSTSTVTSSSVDPLHANFRGMS